MKKLILNIFSIAFVLVFCLQNVNAEEISKEDEEITPKIFATYTAGNLTITSYTKTWTKPMLEELYQELLNNFHGEEIKYLSNIYVYPDSPQGVNGAYYDNIYLQNGEYILGENAIINIFNGDRYNSIEKIAYTLSHEYGHHYIIYNLLEREGIYYPELSKSKYVKIRDLKDKPVFYSESEKGYLYYWDVLEIMADDYVQLLGSSTTKKSYHYKSIDELLREGKPLYENPISFNIKPQLNPYLPLAADTDGLYSYMLWLGGFTLDLKQPQKPKFDKILVSKGVDGKPTYKISLQIPKTEEPYEYTLVIYPKNNPFVPYPLKTFTSKDKPEIIFGSYSVKEKDGKIKSISQNLDGEYSLKLYIKDSRNFIYSTTPITYNFTELAKHIEENKEKEEPKTQQKQPEKENTKNKSDIKTAGPIKNTSLDNIFQIVSKKQKI